MVNPLDFIPKLSGFSPMPLGIMAPFMGYQSAALAYNFGLNYEFGKRVIKSMSNEKFNKIADDPILLNELTSRHHDVLLKAFINEVPKVDKIQDLIIKKMVELEFAKIKVMPELIAQIPKGFLEGLFQLGKGEETEEREDKERQQKRPPREPVKPILPQKPAEPKQRGKTGIALYKSEAAEIQQAYILETEKIVASYKPVISQRAPTPSAKSRLKTLQGFLTHIAKLTENLRSTLRNSTSLQKAKIMQRNIMSNYHSIRVNKIEIAKIIQTYNFSL